MPSVFFISIVVFNLIYVIILIKVKPYKNKIRNTLKILSESLFLIAMLLFAYLVTFSQGLTVTGVKVVGWIIAILFGI